MYGSTGIHEAAAVFLNFHGRLPGDPLIIALVIVEALRKERGIVVHFRRVVWWVGRVPGAKNFSIGCPKISE